MFRTFGRRYVQPTSGGSGGAGVVGRAFGMMRTMNDVQLATHLAAHQAAIHVGAKVVGQELLSNQALEHAKKVHDVIHEEYGPDHPDVKSGKVAVGAKRYPGMYAYGMPEDPLSMRWGSRSGAAEQYARNFLDTGGPVPTKPPKPSGSNDNKNANRAEQLELDLSPEQEQAKETAEAVTPKKVVNEQNFEQYKSDIRARTGQVYTGPKPPKVG